MPIRRLSPALTLACFAMAIRLAGAQAQPEAPDAFASRLFGDMVSLRDARSERISSRDATGGNFDAISLAPGAKATLATIEGAGCVRRFYCGIFSLDRLALRQIVLRAWWDGEEQPSVEVPLGDFFGVLAGWPRRFQSMLVSVNPGSDRYGVDGMVSWFPMPFGKGARIELENQGTMSVPAVWYHVDFERYASLGDGVGRFHAQWRRQNPTSAEGIDPAKRNRQIWPGVNKTGEGNYTILEAQGRGNFAGFFLNIDNLHGGWYGEGDDMIFIDGETWPPSIHGTGTEEIFNGGACPDAEYSGPYSGFHLIERDDYAGKVGMYRFYAADPVRFSKSIRVTIEHGHANNFENDYSSTAFWYQAEPHAAFPPLPPAAERLPRIPEAFAAALELERKVMPELMLALGLNLDSKGPEFAAKAATLKRALAEAYRKSDYAGAARELEAMRDLAREAKGAPRN